MSTSALSVRCQNCGAPLQISSSIRFLTCNYCKAELELVQDSSSTHTRLLEKLQADTQQMRNHLKVLDLQNEIERLDRDWQAWQQENLSRDSTGGYAEPSPYFALLFALVVIVGGSSLVINGAFSGLGFLAKSLILLGIASVVALLYWVTRSETRRYATAKQRYEDLRLQLLFRLRQERQQTD